MNHLWKYAWLIFTLAPAVAFAVQDPSAKQLKLLNDSATALSSSNPDLSQRLTQFAQKESTEKPGNEVAEGPQSGDVPLLQQSAEALQASRPDLAQGLRQYADEESKAEHGQPGASPSTQPPPSSPPPMGNY